MLFKKVTLLSSHAIQSLSALLILRIPYLFRPDLLENVKSILSVDQISRAAFEVESAAIELRRRDSSHLFSLWLNRVEIRAELVRANRLIVKSKTLFEIEAVLSAHIFEHRQLV